MKLAIVTKAVKNILIASSIGVISISSFAQQTVNPSGTSITRGTVPVVSDLNSASFNPAAPSFIMQGNDGFQSNFIAPFGMGYEVGQVDSLIDELDELIDILEDEDLTVQDALDAKDRFEPFLDDAEANGMVKVGGNLMLPFLPLMYYSSDLGTFYADLRLSGTLRSTVLSDDIDVISINDSFKINTSAAVYVKSAGLTSIGLGYSRSIWENESNNVHAGIKVNLNQYELAKNVISLAGLEDGEDIGDAIQDDYENNATSASNIGVDLGVLWVSQSFTAGLSITDVNEPEYDYGSLTASTEQCSALNGISVDNCFVAQNAIASGRINGDEVYVANAQATLSAATWVGEDVKWGFHTSIDLNDKNDAIGDIYQWANAATTVQLNNWLIPELRLGYTKNLAGTELGYYSVGITFFKQAELDVRWSDESVEIDGTSAPRSAYFSFAIQTKF